MNSEEKKTEGTQEIEIDFIDLLRRINRLERLVAGLHNPILRYKRPDSEDYEKLNETLDYLHNKIKEHEDSIHKFISD
jgi:hypothetical protein